MQTEVSTWSIDHFIKNFLVHLFQLHKDDKPYTEAYEKLLDSWSALLADPEFIPPGTLHEQAMEIINSYLQCHLGPPNGLRGQVISML
jgi:hypothetical protein